MGPIEQFQQECLERIEMNGKNRKLMQAADAFMTESTTPKYSYNFSWMNWDCFSDK